MSETEHEQSEIEVPVAQLKDAQEQRNETLLDNLKEKRENLSNKQTYIPIPGYDGEPPILLAKYRLLDGHEIDNIATKVTRETKNQWDRQVLAAVDTFIAACEGLYVDLGDGKKEPDPMTLGGNPILGYNEDLARALEFDSQSARQVVFGVFANNEIAIMQHNVRLSLWMSNTSRKVDDDFLGLV